MPGDTTTPHSHLPPLPRQTTIMAVTYDGGVVLGADSRTSTGTYVANRATDKLTKLTERVRREEKRRDRRGCARSVDPRSPLDSLSHFLLPLSLAPHQIYVCRSGSAADTQNISAYATWYLQQHEVELGAEPTVKAAARLLSRLTYENKAALQAGLIVAGWDGVEGGVVYGVPLGGTVVRLPFAIGGSGSAYISGLCDKLWRPGMTKDAAVAFVRKAVAHAVARDGSSGGCIRTVAIDAGGADRQFVGGDAVPATFGDLLVGGMQRVAVAE